MDPDRYALLTEIVSAALERTEEERARLLDERCAADPTLRREVLELLALADDADSRDLFSETGVAAARDRLELLVEGVDEPDGAWLPERIGGYRIVRSLGSGGMGVVYEAEQESPRRRVAVKLLHPLHATPERRRRFRREAEMLGRLQHPGIAQILEAGFFDAGRGAQPFLAMELVHGDDLRRHCDRARLDVRGRLGILARVGDAVHAAHERGVIHRDLKPENVLVDAHGQPKVLDFGVARASSSSAFLSTMVTEEGQLVGTLSYMAPEQLRSSPDALDARADVYALGVLGFELLTGRLPHDVADLPISAAVARLAEADVPRAGEFAPALRGDVETILGKALEAEPARRYPTAAAFVDDLRRWLGDRPIEARPPTRVYRARKFVRRHRGLTLGAAATLLTLCAGLAVAVVLADRERDQRRRAEANLDASRRNEARVVATLLEAARDAADRGDTWYASSLHRQVPEAGRGWCWDLLARRLPERIDVPHDLPKFSRLPREQVGTRWRFLDDERIVAFDRSRGAVSVVRVAPTREERALFGDLGLDRLGEPTPTGLVLGRRDGETLLLDLEREEVRGRWPTAAGVELGGVSDDGRTVAVQVSPSRAEVWVDGERRHVVDVGAAGSDVQTPHAGVSPDGRTVFVNRQTELVLLDVDAGTERTLLPHGGHDRIVGRGLARGWLSAQWKEGERRRFAVRVQAEGEAILDGGDGEIPIGRGVSSFGAPRDGAFVAYSAGNTIRLRHPTLASPALLSRFQDRLGWARAESAFVTVAEVSPGGRRLLVLTLDRLPWLVDLVPPGGDRGADPRSRAYVEHDRYLYHLAISHDGALVASASASEPLVRIWDSRTLETVRTVERRCREFTSHDAFMAFSRDDERLVMTTPMPGGEGAAVVEWDLLGDAVTTVRPDEPCLAGNHLPLLDLFLDRLDPAPRERLGQKAQMVGRDAVAVWRRHRDTGAPADRPPGSDRGVRWRTVEGSAPWPGHRPLALAVHPTRDEIAVVDSERVSFDAHAASGALTVRSATDDAVLDVVPLPRQPWCVAYSPDGDRIAVGSNDGFVSVLDPEFLTIRYEFRAHDQYVHSLVWTPDGRRLVTLSGDAEVRVWDPRPAAVVAAERERWAALRAAMAARPDLDRRFDSLQGEERSAARVERIRRAGAAGER